MPTGHIPRRFTLRRRSWSSLVLAAALLHIVSAGAFAQVKPLIADASDAFFEKIEIPNLRLTVTEKQLQKLRDEPRTYVKMKLVENGETTYDDVAVKLKGAAGSYREWNDRPALTLNMKKFNKKGEFHSLKKFHLNNSVQDETYLNEWLSSDLFRRAGVPTPRVTFARVWLNDRDVGLYVLKESFDEQFLKRYFPDPTGNLYEGPFCADIDDELEKDSGDDPDDRSDLETLAAACKNSNAAERLEQWKSLVAAEEFFTFTAVERMIFHWDGYTGNRNNYRIYFRPGDGKAVFLPHGMDQTFGAVGAWLFVQSPSLVGAPVTEFNELLDRYRATARRVLPLASPKILLPKILTLNKRVRPLLAKLDPEAAKNRDDQVAELKKRIREQWLALNENIKAPLDAVHEFDESGVAVLDGWHPEGENEHSVVDEQMLDDKETLHISLSQPNSPSWRREILLGPGSYTLTANVQTKDVEKLDEEEPSGVGLGASGVDRPQHLLGTNAWTTLTHEFVVGEDRKSYNFVLEVRAKSGEVWFDRGSLKLIRKPLE